MLHADNAGANLLRFDVDTARINERLGRFWQRLCPLLRQIALHLREDDASVAQARHQTTRHQLGHQELQRGAKVAFIAGNNNYGKN